jgi:hypothetical protein
MEPFIICAAAYAVISVCVGLWLSYYEARDSVYSNPENRNLQVFGWPLLVAGFILMGPFAFAEDLGNRARIKRQEAENPTPSDLEGGE